MSRPDREAEVARVHRRGWLGAVIGNTTAAVMQAILIFVAIPVYVPAAIPIFRLVEIFLVATVPLYIVILLTTWHIGRWVVRRRMEWYLEDRPASREELERFAGLPRLVATLNLIYWTVIVAFHVTYAVHVAHMNLAGWAIPKMLAIYAFGYVTGSSLAYLLLERAFRPYLALILPSDIRTWPPSMRLSSRLLVAWFAVAGAPLLLIAFSWIGLSEQQRTLAASPLRITAILSALIGLVTFVIAGRRLTVPLVRLQQAQRRVAAGDLSARVEIEEAGELGHLEAGFNQMVDGLRTLETDNASLNNELQRQLEAVQASRIRIVEAADAERARIERNLHDGAQQRLLSLSFQLRSVERSLREKRSDIATEGVVAALRGLDAAMAELRELARGIHPAILDEEGLGPALGSLVERANVPTALKTDLPGRLPQPVEITAYFVVTESLANIAKHAEASSASVEARCVNGSLHLEVRDDGTGGADPQRGSGLRGLADRVAALGGEFAIETPPRRGTRVSATIPCS